MAPRKDSPFLLVVEDDIHIREILKHILETHGYRVEEADRAEGVMPLLLKHAFAAAIIDIGLPGYDGLALCRAIRKNVQTAQLPIVICTASKKAKDVLAAKELGVSGYLLKPFKQEEVLERVAAAIEGTSESPEQGGEGKR
jgi:DNA-binding response OmpR family regulator